MINATILTGRLTRDADLRYTSNGTATASFSLAVDRSFKNAQGEKETDFINCVAWRKTAETIANHTRKGSLIGVQGRIQTRNYENQQGQKVYVTEVVVEQFTFLESKNNASAGSRGNQQGRNGNNRPQAQNDPFLANGTPYELDESQLPF